MKSLFTIFIMIILIILLASGSCEDAHYLDLIKEEVGHLLKPYPLSADQLVHTIDSSGKFSTQIFAVEELEEQLTNNDFPEELRNKIRSILWTDSISFQAFTFSQFTGISILDESAGAIRKLNGEVDIFYFTTQTVGMLRTPVNIIRSQNCYTLFGWDYYCWDVDTKVPRAFSMAEISLISDALRSKAYEALYAALIEQENLVYLDEIETTKASIVEIINKQREQSEQQINTILKIYKRDKFVKQLPSNAKNISNAIQEQEFFSIAPMYLEQFFDNLVNNISHKIYDDHAKIVNLILKSLESHMKSNIGSVKFFVTNNQSKIDLYHLFISYNDKEEHYDIWIKFINSEIKLNTSLLIIKINNDDMIHLSDNEEFGTNITRDLMPLMNLFEVVCQYKD